MLTDKVVARRTNVSRRSQGSKRGEIRYEMATIINEMKSIGRSRPSTGVSPLYSITPPLCIFSYGRANPQARAPDLSNKGASWHGVKVAAVPGTIRSGGTALERPIRFAYTVSRFGIFHEIVTRFIERIETRPPFHRSNFDDTCTFRARSRVKIVRSNRRPPLPEVNDVTRFVQRETRMDVITMDSPRMNRNAA